MLREVGDGPREPERSVFMLCTDKTQDSGKKPFNKKNESCMPEFYDTYKQQ
jgi:hypothetical protein